MATSRGSPHTLLKESPWGQKWPRPRGQKFGIEIYWETFKNLLLQNHKAESFHIWYMATSRGPLHILLKESPWGQKWPRLRAQVFTLKYKWKLLKIFVSETTKPRAFVFGK